VASETVFVYVLYFLCCDLLDITQLSVKTSVTDHQVSPKRIVLKANEPFLQNLSLHDWVQICFTVYGSDTHITVWAE